MKDYFKGRFQFDKTLAFPHLAYLRAFHDCRHVCWSEADIQDAPDPIRVGAGLPIGYQGAYYLGSADGVWWWFESQIPKPLHHNRPPKGVPGLRCDWMTTIDGQGLVWNGVRRFYTYTQWLEYLIEHFLDPWGYKLNGTVERVEEEVSLWIKKYQTRYICDTYEYITLENNHIHTEGKIDIIAPDTSELDEDEMEYDKV